MLTFFLCGSRSVIIHPHVLMRTDPDIVLHLHGIWLFVSLPVSGSDCRHAIPPVRRLFASCPHQILTFGKCDVPSLHLPSDVRKNDRLLSHPLSCIPALQYRETAPPDAGLFDSLPAVPHGSYALPPYNSDAVYSVPSPYTGQTPAETLS